MTLEDLWIYADAKELAKQVYFIVNRWSIFDRKTLGDQLVRACDSIVANLAEGYGRFSSTENKRFIMYSRGSLYEVASQLELAHARNLISSEEVEELQALVMKLKKGVIRYHQSIENRRVPGS